MYRCGCFATVRMAQVSLARSCRRMESDFAVSSCKRANITCRASNKTHLSNALLSSTGHTNKDQNYTYNPLETYKLLNDFNVTVRRSGCTSLDIAYCAAGKLDGFWGHGLKPWDRLAALFIAQSSGCLISDFTGTPDTYKSDHMIIATPKCFKELSKCVRAGFQSKE